MREFVEFRIDEQFASCLFSDSEGQRLGPIVRRVELPTNDPRFEEIGRLQTELRLKQGEPFFYGWKIRRHYTKAELAGAELFHLRFKSTFEPAGEECGTQYDETAACPHCGAGAEQIGPLFLNLRRIPKSKDFARTIAGENVVSRRAAELFDRAGVRGISFRPVRTDDANGLESKGWRQLVIHSGDAEIVSPTRVGIDPFDDDTRGEFRCCSGDLLGLNLLSEVSINAATRGGDDIVTSRQFIGTRRGLLRPEREILISPKLRQLIESEKLKGCEIEVAYFS